MLYSTYTIRCTCTHVIALDTSCQGLVVLLTGLLPGVTTGVGWAGPLVEEDVEETDAQDLTREGF